MAKADTTTEQDDRRDEMQEERPEVPMTAWHVFLADMVKLFSDRRWVDVKDFDKLGTLPLEADVILLLKKAVAAVIGQLIRGPLSFLEPRLRDLTVLEYKGPTDMLKRHDVDTARVYGLLGKKKYKVRRDGQVSVVMMYSYAERNLREELAADGLRFEQEEEGIWCHAGSIRLYLVDLMVLGSKRPKSPVNLISARHRQYSHEEGMDPDALALAKRFQYLIQQGKARGMALSELEGYEELQMDAAEIMRQFLEELAPEERLKGLGLKERLKGLEPKERLEGLGSKELLGGLAPKEKAELLALLLAERDQQHD